MRIQKNYALFGVRVTVLILAALVLGACIMSPESDDGSITISVPVSGSGVGGSSLSGSAVITSNTVVRVWMYTPEGNEYRLLSSGTGLPNAPNYRQTTGGGSIVIDNIPAGDGYGIVVAVDKDGGSPFVPTHYAYRDSFAVAAGRETQLSLVLAAVNGSETSMTTALVGDNLHSVIGVVSEVGIDLYAAGNTKFLVDPFVPETGVPVGSFNHTNSNITASRIFSLSPGMITNGNPIPFVNTDVGIFGYDGDGVNSSLVGTGYPVGVRNVTSSGAFEFADEQQQILVYYQRRGGLGGVAFASSGSPNSEDWNDTGTELEDFIGSDESPVWAAAVSDNAVFLSTVFGTFKATEALFSGTEIDIDALIGGDSSSTAGITFFGVAFPGTDRPLRIRHMGYVGGNDNVVVVGTGRGAFYFPESSINSVGANKLVAGVKAIPKTAGNYVVDMSVNDGWIAVLTPSRIVVVNEGTPGTLAYERPLRGYALGNPRDVFVVNGDSKPVVYIAGSEGLSKITF